MLSNLWKQNHGYGSSPSVDHYKVIVMFYTFIEKDCRFSSSHWNKKWEMKTAEMLPATNLYKVHLHKYKLLEGTKSWLEVHI